MSLEEEWDKNVCRDELKILCVGVNLSYSYYSEEMLGVWFGSNFLFHFGKNSHVTNYLHLLSQYCTSCEDFDHICIIESSVH